MSEVNSVSMGPNDGGAKGEFDQKRAEKAVTELLISIGEDPVSYTHLTLPTILRV